jgi:uncharacterized protein (DUF302 family)
MDNGLIIKNSPYDIDTTYTKLRSILHNNPNLKILLELDHSKNASSVDLELNPTKIIMFGNPKLGTPLMQAGSTVSIDLPQKIVVYAVDTTSSKIVYNDPQYLQSRHGIKGREEVLTTISNALNNITNKVIEG